VKWVKVWNWRSGDDKGRGNRIELACLEVVDRPCSEWSADSHITRPTIYLTCSSFLFFSLNSELYFFEQ
jgi:hypothetical protein